MAEDADRDRFPWWLGVLGGLFALLAAALVAASLHDPTPPTYPPVPAGESAVVDSGDARRVTLDARDPDRWVYLDLDRGRVHDSPAEGWDLAARRFHVIANGGPALPGDAAVALPGGRATARADRPAPREWTVTERNEDGELRHPLLADWYEYDFFSHLLTPPPRTYLLRSTEGRLAEIRFLSYYCPGPEAGCVTLRYAFVGRRGGGGSEGPLDDPRDGGARP